MENNKQIKIRCPWLSDDKNYIKYHDTEWGIPVYDDKLLFEMLILEGSQAGLSWLTILKRRKTYRIAYDQFDATKMSQWSEQKIAGLLQDPGIIRNKLKVAAAQSNAKAFLKTGADYGSFSAYIWSFVGNKPTINHWKTLSEVPVTTKESDCMSASLKKHGFKFVGSTICYAYMQAVGMVNDHLTTCYKHKYNKL